jgi:cation transport ATPase
MEENQKYFKYELNIEGMKCSSCSNKIESLLQKYEGVISASVNLISEKAVVILKLPEKIEDIKVHLHDMGFKVTSCFLIHEDNKQYRLMTFELINDSVEESLNFLNLEKIPGLISYAFENKNEPPVTKSTKHSNKKSSCNLNVYCSIKYDPLIVKGRELYEKILIKTGLKSDTTGNNCIKNKNNNQDGILYSESGKSSKFNYINSFKKSLNSFKTHSSSISKFSLIILICVLFSLIFLTMIPNKLNDMIKTVFICTTKLSLHLIFVMILAMIIIIHYGLPIYIKSFKLFWNFKMHNMESLISLGSISALILSLINIYKLIISSKDSDIDMVRMSLSHSMEAAATVIGITIIGKYFEDKAKKSIRFYSIEIFKKNSTEEGMIATWMKPRNKKFFPLEECQCDIGLVEKNEFLILQEGDYLLLDSVIVQGEVEVRENLSFGYDLYSNKTIGDKLKSGTHITKGRCVIMVEEVLEDSMLFKLLSEMSFSLSKKLKFQNFLDKIMNYFVPFIILIAIITLLCWTLVFFWYESHDNLQNNTSKYISFTYIMERAISVLVVSCPCAFGLAIPTVTTIALNIALKQGILIKNVTILPEIKNTRKIIFDKTGTLTDVTKELKIEYDVLSDPDIQTSKNIPERFPISDILCELEKDQKHPIAEVIYSHFLKNKSYMDTKDNIRSSFSISENKIYSESNGVYAEFLFENKNLSVYLGNYEFIYKNCSNFLLSPKLKQVYERCLNSNLNVVFFFVEKEVALVISIDSSSKIRPEAKNVISYLQNYLKKDIFILSGDDVNGVREVGRHLNIPQTNCYGRVDNFKKREIIKSLKLGGQILMIGDGINDVLSLSEADYGISFNSNSQLNLISSDVIFVNNDLQLLRVIFKLSKFTYIFVWLNIFWAGIYNICMLPIAAGIFHFLWKVEITPSFSSLSMMLSSLIILISSNLLRLINFSLNKKKNPQKSHNHVKYKVLRKEDVTSPKISNKKQKYIELV